MERVSSRNYAAEVQGKIVNLRKTLTIIQKELGIEDKKLITTEPNQLALKVQKTTDNESAIINAPTSQSNSCMSLSIQSLIAQQKRQHAQVQQLLNSDKSEIEVKQFSGLKQK